jgi:hypothetical protein
MPRDPTGGVKKDRKKKDKIRKGRSIYGIDKKIKKACNGDN